MSRRAMRWLAAAVLFAKAHAAPVVAERVDPLVGLTDGQREACESPARRKVITGGRRSGKTECVVAMLARAAVLGGECVYISLTRKLAKRTVWKRLKARLRLLRVAFKSNETELKLELAAGGVIELGGADDKEAIERYRGPAYALVVIDECGSHPGALLKALVTDVLRPALMDHRGTLVMAGTPSPVLSGYWAEQAMPDGRRTATCPRWEWTIHHNPLFAGRVDDELEAVRDENSWDEKNVTYRREYLGEWVQDDSVLVYPYNPELNAAQQLPTTTASGYTLTGSRWRHVIGIDVGTTEEAMALVVLAGHPALHDDFLVHGEAHTKMLTDGLVERVRLLLRRFPHAQVVIDAGGMGAAHALELANAGIAFQPAKKTDKASAIRIAHDRVLAGRLKLLTVPSLDGVRKEWASLGWDDDHLQHHPDQADHYSDATLYALRAMHSWNTREDMERPKRVHDDPFEEEEAMALH